jgi:hypothetical protein
VVGELDLDQRNLLRGNLDSEVSARDHDAVGRVQDGVDILERFRPLDLGDDGNPGFALRDQAPQLLDVGRPANEGQSEEIDTEPESEARVVAILLGERRRRQSDAGEIHSLATL